MQTIKIADYMATHLLTFGPGDNVFEAMDRLLDHGVSGGPVVDADGRLVGILSEVDLIAVVMQGSYYEQTQGLVRDYMKAPIDTVEAEMDIYSLAERFIRERRRRYPVLHEGRLVGQISRRDVLRAIREFVKGKPRP
jgi:CBS domain-containing protein